MASSHAHNFTHPTPCLQLNANGFTEIANGISVTGGGVTVMSGGLTVTTGGMTWKGSLVTTDGGVSIAATTANGLYVTTGSATGNLIQGRLLATASAGNALLLSDTVNVLFQVLLPLLLADSRCLRD